MFVFCAITRRRAPPTSCAGFCGVVTTTTYGALGEAAGRGEIETSPVHPGGMSTMSVSISPQ